MKSLPKFCAALFVGVITLATFSPTVAQNADKPFTYVEQMPEFEGGPTDLISFLSQHIRYPEDAQKAGTEGLVIVSFVIDTNGSLGDVKVLKGLTNTIDSEALRVVKLMDGKWKPGMQNGKNVAVRYTLPIRFSMNTSAAAKTPDAQAQFKGGQEALMKQIIQNLKMPAEAKKENLNARVLIKFTIEKDGRVSGIKLENTKLKKTIGPGSELDYMDASSFNIQNKTILAKLAEAAAEALKTTSGNWEPATKNGETVSSEILLPIQFYGSEIEGGNTSPEVLKPTSQEPAAKELDLTAITSVSKLDQKPSFKSGKAEHLKFFAKHTRYPKTDAEGDVVISFMVYDDGSIGKPGVSKSMNPELKEEVLRVLEMSKGMWKPGIKDGKEVTSFHTMTFRFMIDRVTQKNATKLAGDADVVIKTFR